LDICGFKIQNVVGNENSNNNNYLKNELPRTYEEAKDMENYIYPEYRHILVELVGTCMRIY
jgi:hypothetical protein